MERFRFLKTSVLLFFLLLLIYDEVDSINDEGKALLRFRESIESDPYGALADWDERGALDPCLWSGIECYDGKVVVLHLKDLCLKGTLAPELGKLIHMKSLILENNSFSGIIPREIGELQHLEVLDLQHNNFTGPLPSDIGSILSLQILVLRGNRFIGSIPPELLGLNMHSELGIDEDFSSSKKECITRNLGDGTIRRLLQVGGEDRVWHHKNKNKKIKPHEARATALSPSPMPLMSPLSSPVHSLGISPSPLASAPSVLFPPLPTPGPSPLTTTVHPSPVLEPLSEIQPPSTSASSHLPHESPAVPAGTGKKHSNSWMIYMSILVGVSFLLVLSVVYLLCCRANKVVTVRPWATGLSGQLQKAFVTGVPSLKRSELEAACEDFSNIIGSLSDCGLYKGTLSSGVEIVVASTVVPCAKDWSKQSESQFRKKISTLSKVNHKNFMNLLGYCEEQEPFTRMMVFEYAPNGTLFEHLHVKEAEHLDWGARLRIAMGIAYCLEHMHQLDPPVILKNLDSSTIYLTDDYAAKIGDLKFWNEGKETQSQSGNSGPLDLLLPSQESIVYKFGILVLETLTGRLPFSEEKGVVEHWVSCCLNGTMSIKGMIDPTLVSFHEGDAGALIEVVRSCMNPDPMDRPTMTEVAARLKGITAVSPEGATPKVSPLWWAELEILSSEAN